MQFSFCSPTRKSPATKAEPWCTSSPTKAGCPSPTPFLSSLMPRKFCFLLALQKTRFGHCSQSSICPTPQISFMTFFPKLLSKDSSTKTLDSSAPLHSEGLLVMHPQTQSDTTHWENVKLRVLDSCFGYFGFLQLPIASCEFCLFIYLLYILCFLKSR